MKSSAGPVALKGIAVFLMIASLASCGYRFRPDPGSRFADPSVRVDLRPFANVSVFPDAGIMLAGRLREDLRRMGFRGVFDQAGAEYVIEGTVKDIVEDVVSHGADQFALEHRVTLVVNVRVAQLVKGRLLWKEEGLTESASYYSGADFQYTEANRRAAIEEACRRMARRIGQAVRIVL